VKFIAKEDISFPLLSDESKSLALACGILHPGIVRTTCVVDAHGRILHVYEKVNAKGHSACVYADLQIQKTSI
jgi:peroxiredoxin Q/BCP